MKPETTMRRIVVADMLRGTDPISIENPAHPGTPDVNCTLGWLELKCVTEVPRRASTPLRIAHFTNQQRVWLLRRWMADRRAWLLIRLPADDSKILAARTGGVWCLYNGDVAAKRVGMLPLTPLLEAACHLWQGIPSATDFQAALKVG